MSERLAPASELESELHIRLKAVIEKLRSYTIHFEKRRDSRAVFTYGYHMLMSLLARHIDDGRWHNAAWIVELAERFADRYFAAIEAYDAGTAADNPWASAFGMMLSRKSSVLEDMVAGMVVHIVYDLPFALVTVGVKEPIDSKVADFHRMNEVLSAAIDPILDHLLRRYNPLLHPLESVVKRNHEIVSNYGLRWSRALAWYNAARLDSSANVHAATSILKYTDRTLRDLFEPNPWSLQFMLRLYRMTASLGRRWPQHASNPVHAITV